MIASRVYLPKLQAPPSTILEFLFARFPQIAPHVWRDRVTRGVITLSDGSTLQNDSPYRYGIFVFYRREVPSEPASAEEPVIIYRDENILVVDKPHGMPVTPVGQYVDRSLLACLERSGFENVAPMHRLDRETAGLLLLTIKPDIRAQYHRLFAENRIEREYRAFAHMAAPSNQTRWLVENRIERGEPWFRQRIVQGRPNAVTEIELLDVRDKIGMFRLTPQTGKKHQLRIHMASIGFPILGDALYPEKTDNCDQPLQLIATRLQYIDPLSGDHRSFASRASGNTVLAPGVSPGKIHTDGAVP